MKLTLNSGQVIEIQPGEMILVTNFEEVVSLKQLDTGFLQDPAYIGVSETNQEYFLEVIQEKKK